MESNGVFHDEQSSSTNEISEDSRFGGDRVLRRSQSWPPAVCALSDPEAGSSDYPNESSCFRASKASPDLQPPEAHEGQNKMAELDPQKIWTLFHSTSNENSPRGSLPEYLTLDTMQQESPSHSVESRSVKSGKSGGTHAGSESSRSVVTQVDSTCSDLEKKTSFRKVMSDKWAHFIKKSTPSHVKKSFHHYRRKSKERSSSHDTREHHEVKPEPVTNSPHELSYSYGEPFVADDRETEVEGESRRTSRDATDKNMMPSTPTTSSSSDVYLTEKTIFLPYDLRSDTPHINTCSDERGGSPGREGPEGVQHRASAHRMEDAARLPEHERHHSVPKRHLWTANGRIVPHGGARRRSRHGPSGKRRAAREPSPQLFDIEEEHL